MGQKIHPIGLRLKITRGWDSRWFQDKKYTEWLHEDYKIRKFITKYLKNAGVSKIEIERADRVDVIINTAKPGLVIGKKGSGIEELRRRLNNLIKRPVKVTVLEIKTPELDAALVADNIVEQLEKRVAFRRAMKQAVGRTMKAGAKGIKVQCSGRLAGAEIARSERTFEGKVPLHTLRADIDYSIKEAFTTYGQIGVKVWIYRGDILPMAKVRPVAEKTLLASNREE
ncbi:MAG: 30S ribosomal protein S3 [Vulcanimicrobiota bacterium]